MTIGWRASELYFLAQGRGPYVLAFGSSRYLRLQNASLAGDGRLQLAAVDAEIGAPVGFAKISATPKSDDEGQAPVAWQRYLVWGLLLLGAMLLSGMAWMLLNH